MDVLDKIFHDVSETALIKRVLIEVLTRQLTKQGVTLRPDQRSKIEQRLEEFDLADGESAFANIDLNNCGLEDDFPEGVVIDFNDAEDLDQILSELMQKIAATIPNILAETSSSVLSHLKLDAPRMLNEHQAIRKGFETRLSEKWGAAFDLLEMLIVVAVEAVSDFNKDFHPDAVQAKDFVFDALVRLHARASQVALEILTLLHAGYADGAHARWRTLHEINVVASFIEKSGNDVAERYLLHNHVESRRAAQEYQNNALRLALKPIPEEKIAEIEATYQALIVRFGPHYVNSYGWAEAALKNRNPNFSHIEQNVDLNHMRPYYRLASHNVHANPKGVMFKLGLPHSDNVLLAGASNAGLVDPGSGTAVSIYQITTILLTTKPNIDRLVTCEVMGRLVTEAGEAFMTAHSSLKND